MIHPLGNSLDLQAIKKLKAGSDFFILEDNAESLGSGNGNEFAGTVGDFGSYSFYYSHHMTTVEGGMVTTNCEEFANDLLSMRAHGWTRNRGDKLKTEQLYPNLPNEFLFVTPGFNFRPMEFQGALGSSQLKRLDLFISKRIQNAKLINQALSHSRFRLIGSESFGQEFEQNVNYGPVKHSWMALPISCGVNSVEKNEICKKLEGVGIATRPLLAGDFSSQPAGNYPGIEIYGQLDNSKEIYATSFMIGNHHNYSDSQMDYLASKLVEISAQYE